MHNDYRDILKRINEKPVWYDPNGVPRYDRFHPHMLPDIYCQEAVLVEIKCQDCGEIFLVGASYDRLTDILKGQTTVRFSDELAVAQRNNRQWPPEWWWGDPPRHGCIGDTMSATTVRLVELWKREDEILTWKCIYPKEP